MAILWMLVTSYLHFYLMSRFARRAFNLHLFRWRNWEITYDRLLSKFWPGLSTISNFRANTNYIYLN